MPVPNDCLFGHFKLMNEYPPPQLRTYAYADKAREKQRLAALAASDLAAASRDPKENAAREKKRKGAISKEEAWSLQKERKVIRDLRKTKKERKRAFLKAQREGGGGGVASKEGEGGDKMDDDDDEDSDESDNGDGGDAPREAGGKRPGRGGAGQADADDDDDELEDDWTAEERAAKKMRRGKVTEKEFHKTFFAGL